MNNRVALVHPVSVHFKILKLFLPLLHRITKDFTPKRAEGLYNYTKMLKPRGENACSRLCATGFDPLEAFEMCTSNIKPQDFLG